MYKKRSIKKTNNSFNNKESFNKEPLNINNNSLNNTINVSNMDISDLNTTNNKEYIEEKIPINQINQTNQQLQNDANHLTDRPQPKFLQFCAWYAVTGDAETAYKKSGYELTVNMSTLLEKYKGYNLPEPPDPRTRAEIMAIIADKLSKNDLADLIVKSAQEGKDNRIANMLLELYLQQERMQTIDEYRAAEIDQRFRWAIEEPDILVVLTSMLNLQAAPEIVSSLPFWREMGAKYGQEKIAEVKSLIEQVLAKLPIVDYIDNRQLGETNSENVPAKRKPGRPKKVK
jgi:hypothetical protein